MKKILVFLRRICEHHACPLSPNYQSYGRRELEHDVVAAANRLLDPSYDMGGGVPISPHEVYAEAIGAQPESTRNANILTKTSLTKILPTFC